MLKILEDRNPDESAFFMATASGPCRLGRYCNFQRQVLEKKGYTNVPILTATSSDSYSEIPGLGSKKFQMDFLQSLAAADILKRALFRIRPYEVTPGSADALFVKWLKEFEKALEEGSSLSAQAKKAASEFSSFPQKNIPR